MRSFNAARPVMRRTPLMEMLFRQDREGMEQATEAALTAMRKELSEIRVPLLTAFLEAGDAAAREFRAVAKRAPQQPRTAEAAVEAIFNHTDPQTLAVANNYVDELIVETVRESRVAISRILTEAWTKGTPVRRVSSLIKSVIGLDERSAMAVQHLRERMLANPGKLVYAGKTPVRVPASGPTVAQLERVSNRYAERLLKVRAENIARTGTMRIANEGQRQLWVQQVRKGNLNMEVRREVIITPDERLCPICSRMAGERRSLFQNFSKGEPPFHPRCRCTTGLVRSTVRRVS